MKKKSIEILSIIAIIIIIPVFLYCSYWVAKNISYSVFYKDMVQQTITEMVKPEALLQHS